MKVKLLLVAVVILLILAVGPADVMADGRVVSDDISDDQKQILAAQSSELSGGLWGWQMTRYKSFDASYKIGNQTLLLLSTEVAVNPTDSVLWNPLTGRGRHLDKDEYAAFWSAGRENKIPTWQFPIQMFGGRTLQVLPSPGQRSSCHALPFQYYSVADSEQAVIGQFYIVHLLDPAKKIKYPVCHEAEPIQEREMQVGLALDFNFAADLSDGTLLFESGDGANVLSIIRIDGDFRQHTTLGGQIVVIEAAGINAALRPNDNDSDMYDAFNTAFHALANLSKILSVHKNVFGAD